jgi:hypothetical protein
MMNNHDDRQAAPARFIGLGYLAGITPQTASIGLLLRLDDMRFGPVLRNNLSIVGAILFIQQRVNQECCLSKEQSGKLRC